MARSSLCHRRPARAVLSLVAQASLPVLLVSLFAIPSGRSADDSPLALLVVWPPKGVTVDGSQVRVGGRTDPDAEVTVNGRALRVYPSGAFAGTCPLKFGSNRLLFRAAKNKTTATSVRTVTRRKPLRSLPAEPVRFDPDFEGEPSEDLEVRPGDTIRIRVKGSPGQKATFRIGSGETHYPLFPSSINGVTGFYEGAYQVKPTNRFIRARVTCYLAAARGRRRPAAQLVLPARITVNTNPFPDVGRVEKDYVRLRAEPNHGAPLALAPRGTYLNVVGHVGDRIRVALTPSLHGWLRREQVEIAKDEPPLRQGLVRNIAMSERDSATVIRIPLGLRVPFAVAERSHSPMVELTLFGVENCLNWITDRVPRGLVETIAVVPSGDGTCRFLISLRTGGPEGPHPDSPRLLGYRAYYEGTDLCVVLRHPLTAPKDRARPLAGRTILLDPGHGGTSKGTIGSTGLEEKTTNLELCRMLRNQLERQGARVVMMRSGDTDVSLADRARQAEQRGDLFVSIHNNSIGLTDDPLRVRGAGVFYYHSHSRDVARAIYRRILRVEPPPTPYGVVTADLFVVREITAMPSVLVECLFLSHPEDEMLLLDKQFAERYVEAVAAGIADWFVAVGKSAPEGR